MGFELGPNFSLGSSQWSLGPSPPSTVDLTHLYPCKSAHSQQNNHNILPVQYIGI